MVNLKTNKRLLKVVFLFKKFALSKGDSVLRRWVNNTINYNYTLVNIDCETKESFEKIKYGDIIEFIIKKNQERGFVNIYSDYYLEIIRLFKNAQLTFPWSESKEGYDYWNNFFNEFARFLYKDL